MNGNLKKNLNDFSGMDFTIHPSTEFGVFVRISKFVVIEENCSIGDNSFIGNFVMMRPGTKIGKRTMIGHGTVFEGDCEIGDDTLIHAQCHITKGAKIGSKVFIAPGFIGANDPRMCHQRPWMNFKPEAYEIKDFVRIAIGVLVLPNVVIGENSVIAAGSVVTKDIPDKSIVMGCPARVVGKVPKSEWLS